MNYSRVQNYQKNQRQHIPTNAAMPQNRMIRRSSSSDLSEDWLFESLASLAIDSSNSFSSSAPPTAPKSADQPPKIPFQKQKAAVGIKDVGKPGILSLLANKEAGPFQNKHIVSSYWLQLHKELSGVSSPIKTKTTSEKTGDEIPDASNPDNKPRVKNPTSNFSQGPIQFGSRRGIRFRHDSPCVFELTGWRHSAAPPRVSSDKNLLSRAEPGTSSEIRGHAIINPEGNACFRPLTFCTVHKSAGVLMLEDIQDSECYSRMELRIPVAKVTHRFNDCVLKFPPTHTQLIVFKPPNNLQKAIMNGSLSLPPPPPPPPPPRKGDRYLYPSKSPKLPVNFMRYCVDCNKVLVDTSDIYVYRGDKWFCSEECRYSSTLKAKELRKKAALELKRQRAKIERAKAANRAKAVRESEVASGKLNNKGKWKPIFFME